MNTENHSNISRIPFSVELRKMLQLVDNASEATLPDALAPVQNIITLVNFANDECDYGMGLELGLDLFLFGSPRLHKMAMFLLDNAYSLLNRPKFSEILKDHLEDRRRDQIEHLKLLADCDAKDLPDDVELSSDACSIELQDTLTE